MKTYKQAEDAARAQSRGHQTVDKWLGLKNEKPTGHCLQAVRTLYGVPSKYGTAAQAWHYAVHKHTSGSTGPAGALEFWTGGSEGDGHVALSVGGGWCWSTDFQRPGYFDLVQTAEITRKWGLKYVGWSEDVNGKRVIKVIPKTKWTPIRRQVLELLTSDDVKVVAERRPKVRIFVKLALAALNKTPEN